MTPMDANEGRATLAQPIWLSNVGPPPHDKLRALSLSNGLVGGPIRERPTGERE